MKDTEILVMPGAYFSVAAGVLLLPLNWFVAAVAAAGFHELCHLVVLKFCKEPIHQIIVGCFGTKITTGELTPLVELLSATAGPLGSFCLLLFLRRFPLLSILGLAQGLFNLMPIWPMDGGRILRSIFMLAKNPH